MQVWRFISFSTALAGTTVSAATDVFTKNGHGLLNGDPVQLTGTGLPAPLVVGTIYWVRDVTANTFKLSATPGAAAIDITTAGTVWTVQKRTINLDMLDRTGWLLGEGLDIGRAAPERKYLTQEGVDGAELASSWVHVVQISMPLILMPQTASYDMQTKLDAINAELTKVTNIIEALPDGLDPTGGYYEIMTFRSDAVSSYDGAAFPSQWIKRDGKLFMLQIDRSHPMIGRGAIF